MQITHAHSDDSYTCSYMHDWVCILRHIGCDHHLFTMSTPPRTYMYISYRSYHMYNPPILHMLAVSNVYIETFKYMTVYRYDITIQSTPTCTTTSITVPVQQCVHSIVPTIVLCESLCTYTHVCASCSFDTHCVCSCVRSPLK